MSPPSVSHENNFVILLCLAYACFNLCYLGKQKAMNSHLQLYSWNTEMPQRFVLDSLENEQFIQEWGLAIE